MILSIEAFDQLLVLLQNSGFQTIGPHVRDKAIVLGSIRTSQDLPIGWSESQSPGKYTLQASSDSSLFAYTVGPQAWKKFLVPERQLLFRARTQRGKIKIEPAKESLPRYAFVGLRSCDLAALKIQDQIYTQNSNYQKIRKQLFLIAVQCTQAAETCFCVSMNTGPEAREDFDLALTEVVDRSEHYFLLQVGSERGKSLISKLKLPPATARQRKQATDLRSKARVQTRSLDPIQAREVLKHSAQAKTWEEIAQKCLSCANCTMVCPTCFCSTTEEVSDLTGEHTERWLRWDSCFTKDFTQLTSGSIRANTQSQYRQWLTHKLSTWWDQFDSSGCVGCGRCVTWCPAQIDLTAELKSFSAEGPK